MINKKKVPINKEVVKLLCHNKIGSAVIKLDDKTTAQIISYNDKSINGYPVVLKYKEVLSNDNIIHANYNGVLEDGNSLNLYVSKNYYNKHKNLFVIKTINNKDTPTTSQKIKETSDKMFNDINHIVDKWCDLNKERNAFFCVGTDTKIISKKENNKEVPYFDKGCYDFFKVKGDSQNLALAIANLCKSRKTIFAVIVSAVQLLMYKENMTNINEFVQKHFKTNE